MNPGFAKGFWVTLGVLACIFIVGMMFKLVK